MPFAKLEQHSIFYAARGETGAPLVFVHGAGGSHLTWNGQLAALSDAARTFGIDLPGHGRSALPGCRTLREYAQVLAHFLDALQLERAVVVGNSMGGAIALTLALEFPARVHGVGLVATGARLRVAPALLDGIRADFENTARRANAAWFAPTADAALVRLSEQRTLETAPQVMYDDYAACNEFDVLARLSEIQVPALVLCGRADVVTPLKYSEYLAAHLPRAHLRVVADAGHMVMLEKPDAVNDALREFLTAW